MSRILSECTSIKDKNNDNLIHALDPRFEYGGQWLTKACGKEIRKNGNWPCSDVRFDVNVTQVNNDITIIWYGLNSRIRVSIQKYNENYTSMVEQQQQYVFQGSSIWNKCMKSTILSFPETGRFSVWIQYIYIYLYITSCPFGPGIDGKVIGGSMLDFVGTAFDYALGGCTYEDCGKAYESQLATKSQASLSIQVREENKLTSMKEELASYGDPEVVYKHSGQHNEKFESSH